MRKLLLILPIITLTACTSHSADTLKALAADPATVSVRETFNGFGVQETVEYVRGNSTNTQATASQNGTGVNIPSNATINTPIVVK